MKSIDVHRKNVIQTSVPGRQSPVVRASQTAASSQTANALSGNSVNLKPAALTSQQLLLSAQRELGMAQKLRVQAQRYLQDMQIKARSEAQQLILHTRLTVRKETQELIRQANEEIQKALADIRVIRIIAQEELAAQKKFTDAARLRTFTLSLQKDELEAEKSSDKKPALKKQAVH